MTLVHAPRVSVIVPTRSRPVMLRRAVASILSQTFSDLEVIVVDDAGDDPTPVLETFDDARVRLARHTQNGGLAAARNTGLQLSRGEFIAYLDDDDYFLPQHCERLVELLDRTGAVMAYSDGLATEESWEGETVTVLKQELTYSRDFELPRILCDNFLPVNAAMHRRSVLLQTGGFDETLRVHEDWEHWIRVAGTGGRIVHDPTVTCEYTTRPGTGNMRTQWHAKFLETFQIIHHRYAQAAAAIGVAGAQTEVRRLCAAWSQHQAGTMPVEELTEFVRTGIPRRLAHGAARLRESDDGSAVLSLLETVVQRVPDEAEAWLGLAAAYRFAGRPDHALGALGKAVRGGESDALYAELAHACAALGKSADAERFTAVAVQRTGQTPPAIEPAPLRRGVVVPDLAPAMAPVAV